MSQFPRATEYPWGYYEIQTDNFFYRVYKFGGGNGRPITYRAESSVKINERRYLINLRKFHEWDYRDREDAFENAKMWVHDQIEALANELCEALPPEAKNMP